MNERASPGREGETSRLSYRQGCTARIDCKRRMSVFEQCISLASNAPMPPCETCEQQTGLLLHLLSAAMPIACALLNVSQRLEPYRSLNSQSKTSQYCQ